MSENPLEEFKGSFQRLLELRIDADIKAVAADKAKSEYKQYESQLYAELQDAGIRGRLVFDFGGDLGVVKFQRRSTKYGRVIDKRAAAESLKKMGLADELVDNTAFRAGRLNEKVRTWLETNQELPEGIDWYDQKGISISRK